MIIFVVAQSEEPQFDKGVVSDSSNGLDMIDELECLWSIYDERERERKQHVVNGGIGLMSQCWLTARAFVEVYVSLLIRCQWAARPGGEVHI